MATCVDEFEEWLCTKLKALNTDQDVFSSYIRSILEGDDSRDEKLEALEGILIEIVSDGNLTLGMEIMDKWDCISRAQINNAPLKFDVDAQLASIMEKQAISVVTERKITDEERQYREAILAQYSHVSDNDEEDEEEICSKDVVLATASVSSGVMRNTNADDVMKAEKDKREKAKAECEKKKAVDKANKEKQKQQQQERKEKEKKRTQKGERKR